MSKSLKEAVVNGDLREARKLPDEGADIDARNRDGYTPLHWAAIDGQAGTAALLLARGADVDARDERGATPLHYVREKGHTRTTDVLLEYVGVDKPPGKARSRILRHASGL